MRPSLTRIVLFVTVLAPALRSQGVETLPGSLPRADRRAVPATPGEGRALVVLLDTERAALESDQRERPTPERARTIQLLEEQIEAIRRLEARRADLAAEMARLGRATTEAEELRKRLDLAGREEEPLPDPAAPGAEIGLARDRAATGDLIQAEQTRLEEATAALETLRLEQERLLRKLPVAKRDLAEAQADLADYETDSREAVQGGLGGDQARVMLEQVCLYRLRVAEHKAAVEALAYGAGDLRDVLIDNKALEIAVAEETLRRLEARRRTIDALAGRASEARLDRVRSELDAAGRTADGAPDWARPYWRLRQRLARINLDLAEAGKSQRRVELMISEGGAVATLHAELAEEARQLARVDRGEVELEDVVPGTTRGLLQLIARREADLAALHRYQDDIRALRKDLRERQRAARDDDQTSLAAEIEGSRAALQIPDGADLFDAAAREASSPASWDALAGSIKTAAAARAKLLTGHAEGLGAASQKLLEARNDGVRNLLRYRSALLWTRDRSEISAESIDRARADVTDLPRVVGAAVSGAAGAAVAWTSDAARGGRFSRLAGCAIALAAACLLVRAGARHGPAAVKRVVHGVRFTALPAIAGVALPAIAGADSRTVAICAAVSAPPFLYQLARVLIDVLFGAGPGDRGTLGLPAGGARVLRSTSVLLLRVCAVFVPLAVLLTVSGYRDRNPGLVELLWLANSIGCYLVVLAVLLRPSGISTMIRRKTGAIDRPSVGRSAAAAGYPAAIAAVIFLLVLQSLSYRVAARYFLERFLISAAWIAGAVLVRRWFLRILFGGQPRLSAPPLELASQADQYEAAGRRALLDRLRRLAVTLLVFGPALFFTLDAWGLTGPGWDAMMAVELPAIAENLTLGAVVSAILTTAVAFFVVRSTRDVLRFVVLPRTSIDVGVRYTIVTLTTYVLVAIAGIVILGGQLKVSPAVIGGFVAALGLGLGFGLQEIINNFFSGLILLVERPLKVGDIVSVSGTVGRVDRINMRSTTIMTGDNTGVIVPNKDLISATVTNWSAGTPTIRITVPLSISYGSDTALFKRVVGGIVEAHALILKSPPPDLSFSGFGNSSLDFQLQYWIRLGSPGGKIKSDLHYALDEAFRRHGIEMPYPQQDVHVKSWPQTGPPGLPAHGGEGLGREAGAARDG